MKPRDHRTKTETGTAVQTIRSHPATRATLASAAALSLLGVALWTTPGDSAQTASASNKGARVQEGCRLPGPYELPHGGQRVDLNPAHFSHRITNKFWPMKPGTRWVYRESDGDSVQRVRVTVLERTRDVRGIKARVVHDVVREDGEIIENTFDWYGQDSGGSIWYLGEFSREYENGVPVNTEGSWEYGVDGAQAGVIMPANPTVGCRYRQEHLAGEAEDKAAILSLREDIRVRAGRFRDVLTTGDYVSLEPWVTEHKFFAKGVGPVLAAGLSPGPSTEALVKVHIPRG